QARAPTPQCPLRQLRFPYLYQASFHGLLFGLHWFDARAAVPPARRPFGALRIERDTGRAVEFSDELVEQLEERSAFFWIERRQHPGLRPARRFDELNKHLLASRRQCQIVASAVLLFDLSLDQARRFELAEHHPRRRAVETQKLRD